MEDLRTCLLVTRTQLEAFERSMGDRLEPKMRSCLRWLEGIPLETWFNPVERVRDPEARKEVIQTICALYWHRDVNISFNEYMWLKLHPRNEQERLAWLKANGWHVSE